MFMETIKNVSIFLPAHLALFAKHIFPSDKNGRLKIQNIVLLANRRNVERKMNDKMVEIPIAMYRPTVQAKNAFCAYLRQLFFQELCFVVYAFKNTGFSVKDGVDSFLNKYKINEDVYKHATAYRMFNKKKHDK